MGFEVAASTVRVVAFLRRAAPVRRLDVALGSVGSEGTEEVVVVWGIPILPPWPDPKTVT